MTSPRGSLPTAPERPRMPTQDLRSITRTSFTVPATETDRLRRRLDEAVLPAQTPGADWTRGIPVSLLADLLGRWRDGYSWPEAERRLGREDHLTYSEPGARVHAVRRAARTDGTLPVLALHGWPYTYAQMLPLADALDGSHELVAPSLPGFLHSPALDRPFGARTVAEILHRLMTSGLGHDRYLVYGEDMGAPVADWMAALYPGAVAGIVATHPSFSAQAREGQTLDEDERTFLASTHQHAESGYAHLQGTRPDTLAAALQDSPLGLLAWIAEKVAAWSHGGHATGLDAVDTDELLTIVSLYWHTQSIGTSMRSYCEPDDFDAHPVVTVPAAVLTNTHEASYPRSLAEKSYSDLRSFGTLHDAGHFTAWENPGAVAEAIRSHADSLARP